MTFFLRPHKLQVSAHLRLEGGRPNETQCLSVPGSFHDKERLVNSQSIGSTTMLSLPLASVPLTQGLPVLAGAPNLRRSRPKKS